jgi:hypothetical protein
MLYSVPIKFNDKEYRVKIGTRQLIELQESGIELEKADTEWRVTFQILHFCIRDIDMTVDELIDTFDNSEYSIEDLKDIIEKAKELGLNKGKSQKKMEIATETNI